ncbi:histidine kinase [Haloferax sp. MBLA0076]|uniref:Histidine kinase n=1 Tax=Haloferax litoreum TaxID=2666140 RepID=A0A6A8GF49_9EURY|nr:MULTISPECIES: histidine kinase [Haloferax]KAB1193279.1 histidine kinase [Haloferax sp. CBA1148]MRX21778.1 histidine kinase [Haloferax litoreum]
MALEDFLDAIEPSRRSLSVVNRSAPDPVLRMLETTFEDQSVQVGEQIVADRGDDVVVLSEETGDGREILATSPLEELMNTILLVNSDLYKTGQTDLDTFELPAVLTELDDVPFKLRGYPESDKEKLLLVAISRYIERHAWRSGAGRLRSSFQRLSRIKDERGTRVVYKKIASTDVQTHVYGVTDWTPPFDFGVRSHGGYTADYRDSWFVVYTPPDDSLPGRPDQPPVALLALETEPKRWEGYWTFDSSLVADIDDYIARNM